MALPVMHKALTANAYSLLLLCPSEAATIAAQYITKPIHICVVRRRKAPRRRGPARHRSRAPGRRSCLNRGLRAAGETRRATPCREAEKDLALRGIHFRFDLFFRQAGN